MSKNKSYYDFLSEISSDELYKGLLAHGLFTEKMPPVFSSESFYNYCTTQTPTFPKKASEYVYHESMRNINTPRPLGIPNPAAYHVLCKYISEIWPQLLEHFKETTDGQKYTISRTHIRKNKKTPSLFVMNYKNWREDGMPEPDLLIGSKYLVHADISNCFPSIYTHALSWALVGKEEAKQNQRDNSKWYNKLDVHTRNLKFGETHGLLIGPHASNLLSEIILTKIDQQLYNQGWRFIRNIDDYTCYVPTYESGQLFLNALTELLRSFDLSLNHKKTSIEELPTASVEQWVRKINTFTAVDSKDTVNFKEVRAYLDLAIDLMRDNNDNAAILNYAIKVLARKKLTDNAKLYYCKTILHLAVIYPYLVSLLEEYVFEPFAIDAAQLNAFAGILYKESKKINNYEALCYAIYYAIKYGFTIEDISEFDAPNSGNCLFMLFEYLYFRKHNNREAIKECKKYARSVRETEMESLWLFIYEVLPQSDLKEYWKNMKANNVSFIVPTI